MVNALKLAFAIAGKDIRVELRTRTSLLSAAVFAVLVLLVFNFGRDPTAVATIDLRVDFHVAASGSDLHAHAEILRLGKNLGSVDVRVVDSSDRLVASGKVLCINPKSA